MADETTDGDAAALANRFGRVWWPADAATLASGAPLATDRSAAFHPVELLSQADDGSYSVRYGDGRTASAPPECVLPYDNPVEFGAEEIPIQAGELVEVQTGDGAAQFARVAKVTEILATGLLVEFPFQRRPKAAVQEAQLRRPRFFDPHEDNWNLAKPFQTWALGQCPSPFHLEIISEDAYFQHLAEAAQAAEALAAAPPSADDAPAAGTKRRRTGHTQSPPPSGLGHAAATATAAHVVPLHDGSIGGMSPGAVLMWVAPVAPRSSDGDEMLFRMTPAGAVPAGSWPTFAKAGCWEAGGAVQVTAHAAPTLPPATTQTAPPSGRGKNSAQTTQPKRAKNAYLVFLARNEPLVAAQHHGWSRNQVMNVVAAMWKKVSPEEKKSCQDEADQDKLRYKAELAAWKAAHPDAAAGPVPAKPKSSKKPHSAYILFLKDFQAKLRPGSGGAAAAAAAADCEEARLLAAHGGDVNLAVAAAWKDLSEAERSVYKRRASDLRAQKNAGAAHKSAPTLPPLEHARSSGVPAIPMPPLYTDPSLDTIAAAVMNLEGPEAVLPASAGALDEVAGPGLLPEAPAAPPGEAVAARELPMPPPLDVGTGRSRRSAR